MLKAYVKIIVRDPVLADDTFSDVTLAILRSWRRFDRNRPFSPWARGIARRVALATLRAQAKRPCVLDHSILDSIAYEIDKAGEEVDLATRKEALRHCLKRLSEKNQQLIRLRYFEDRPYADIAAAAQKTVGALYVVFSRLHKALLRCVERELRSL
jgi:RNA polymerase sigma-70 factor (ECF subfamily)